DTEEYGFDTYKSIIGNDTESVARTEQELMGGLGGSRSDLSSREACFLLAEYMDFNKEHGIELPGDTREYIFMLEDAFSDPLSEEEKDVLANKTCTPIKSEYHLINYFLMRCLGKDYKGAEYLCRGFDPWSVFPDIPMCTLCRNASDPSDLTDVRPGDTGGDLSSEGVFLCQSLIEYDKKYSILVSRIEVHDMKVTDCRLESSMQISPAEAAMLLSRSEFITVYEIMASVKDMEKYTWDLAAGTIVTIHDNGKLMMSFNENNDHVNKRVFRLSEDVFGLYYITDYGQFIISSHSLKNIRKMEDVISSGPLDSLLLPLGKYEFKEPILYEFIQSDYDNFEEFMEDLEPDE
ncbi:MAG TPA: hypothetical protein PLM92_05490, partial [Bacillota bacterium]|nr:hypothetical protein [Bacillota bacterium]